MEKTAEEILQDYGCGTIPFSEYVKMYYPAIIGAMEAYASQFKQPDAWISVEDRLPEDGNIVQVSFINTAKETCQCSAWFQKVTRYSGEDSPKDNRWFVFPSPGHKLYPTHWQPLPTPPSK